MSRENLIEEFKQLLADYCDIEVESLEEDDRLAQDVGLDSLDKIDLFTQLESKYDISISDEDIEEQITVGDTINYLLKRL